MDKKKREAALKKKREYERERRRKIRENPVLKEKEKEKERLRYLKKKQNKPALDNRSKRIQRRIWRENKRKYRSEKKFRQEQLDKILYLNTPNESEEENVPPEINNLNLSNAKRQAQIRKRRYRESLKQKNLCTKLKKELTRYKKKYYRLKQKNQQTDELKDNVNDIIKSGEKEIAKELLFSQILKKQLEENYRNLNTHKGKQLFTSFLGGKLLKKYRVLSQLQKYPYNRQLSKSQLNLCHVRKSKINLIMKQKIENFIQDDENSRMCPGKKEFVRSGQNINQKRFLNDTLKNLHLKFLLIYPKENISYTLFCRNCPFWVKQMKVSDRDTCKCIVHSNMEFIINVISKHGVIAQSNISELINFTCCSNTPTCLLGNCETCVNKIILFNEVNISSDKIVSYYKWCHIKEKFFCNKTKKEKVISKTVKQEIKTKLSDLIQEFKQTFSEFLCHEGRILHQYITMRHLKLSLQNNEVLIHIDFSENYNLKFSEEIQSFHFGGSRPQITMHTVVVYTRCDSGIKAQSYCTLSDSLSHNVPAIWAHLIPILKELSPNINTLHFLSDSPATQYRNKTMFYFLAKHLKQLHEPLQHFTWNYSEAGHGKGAPDGIGGVCKRTADRIIANGQDIANIQILYKLLSENLKGIKLFMVKKEDIEDIAGRINVDVIIPFQGTMKVHQVVFNQNGNLEMRKLSCFKCNSACYHYGIGILKYSACNINESSEEDITSFAGPSRVTYKDVYDSSTSSSEDESAFSQEKFLFAKHFNLLKEGIFLLVEFPGSKGKKYRYVCLCQDAPVEGLSGPEIEIISLKSTDVTKKIFEVLEDDISYISMDQICEVLETPLRDIRDEKTFYKFSKQICVFEY